MKGIAKKVLCYLLMFACVLTTLPYIAEPEQVDAASFSGSTLTVKSGGDTHSEAKNKCVVGYRVSLYCTAQKGGKPCLPQIATDEFSDKPIMKAFDSKNNADKYYYSEDGASTLVQTYYRDKAAQLSCVVFINNCRPNGGYDDWNDTHGIYQLKPTSNYNQTYENQKWQKLDKNSVVSKNFHNNNNNEVYKLLNKWSDKKLDDVMTTTWYSGIEQGASILNPKAVSAFNKVDKKLSGTNGLVYKKKLIRAFKNYTNDAYYELCINNPESVYLQVEPVAILNYIGAQQGFLTTYSEAQLALQVKHKNNYYDNFKINTFRGVFSWRQKTSKKKAYYAIRFMHVYRGDPKLLKTTKSGKNFYLQRYKTNYNAGKGYGCKTDNSVAATVILGGPYNNKIWGKSTSMDNNIGSYSNRSGIVYYGCGDSPDTQYSEVTETVSLLFDGSVDEDTLNITDGHWQSTDALSVMQFDKKVKYSSNNFGTIDNGSTIKFYDSKDIISDNDKDIDIAKKDILFRYIDITNQKLKGKYSNVYTYTKTNDYKETTTNAYGQVGFSKDSDTSDYDLVGFYSFLVRNPIKNDSDANLAKQIGTYTQKLVNKEINKTDIDGNIDKISALQASWRPNLVEYGDENLNAGVTINLKNLSYLNDNGTKENNNLLSIVQNQILNKVYANAEKDYGISRVLQYPYYGTPSSNSFTTVTQNSSKLEDNILADKYAGYDVKLLVNTSATAYGKDNGSHIASNLFALSGKIKDEDDNPKDNPHSLALQAYYLEGATFKGLLGTTQTQMKKLNKITEDKKYALNVLVAAKTSKVTSYYTWAIWDFKKEQMGNSGTKNKTYDITSFAQFPLGADGQQGIKRVIIVPNKGAIKGQDSKTEIAMTQEELENIVTNSCRGANEYASEKTIIGNIWQKITENLTEKLDKEDGYPVNSAVNQYMRDILDLYGSNSDTNLYKHNSGQTAAVGFYKNENIVLEDNNSDNEDLPTEEGIDYVPETNDDETDIDENPDDTTDESDEENVEQSNDSTCGEVNVNETDASDDINYDEYANETFAMFNIKLTEQDFLDKMNNYLSENGVKSIVYIQADIESISQNSYNIGSQLDSDTLQTLVSALNNGYFFYCEKKDAGDSDAMDSAISICDDFDEEGLKDICKHIGVDYKEPEYKYGSDDDEDFVSDADDIETGDLELENPEAGEDIGNSLTNNHITEQRGYTIIAVGYTGKRVRTAGIELQPWELNYVYADLQAALMYNTQQVARMQKDSTGKPIESEHNNFDVGYLGGAYASTLSSNSRTDLHSKADIWSYTGVHSTSYCNDGHVSNNNVVKRDTESHNTRDAWVDYIPSKESWDNDNTLFSYNIIVSDETKGRSGIEDNSKDENYAYWINANKLHANNDNDTDKNNYSLFLYSNPIMNDIWSVANSSRGYNNTSINWSTWSRLSKNFNYDNDYKKHYFTVNTMRESAYLSYVYNLIRYISGDERVVSSIYNYDADENIINELKDTKETSVQEFLEKCLLMKSANIPNLDVSKLSQTSSVIGNNKRAVRTLYNKDYLNGSVPKGAISEHLVLNAYMQDDNDDLGTGNNIDISTNNTTGDTPVYHTRTNAHSGQDKTIQWTHKVAHDVPLQSGEHCHYQIGIDTYSWSDENGFHTSTVSTRIDHECYHERKIQGVMPAAFLFRTVNIDTGNINEEENEDTYNLDYSEKIYKYITDKMDIGENNTDTGIIDTNGEIDNSTKDNLTVKPSSTTSTTQNALPEMVTSKTPDTLGNNNSNINTNFSSAFFDSQRDAMDTMNKVTFGYFPEVNMLSYVYDKGQTLSGKNGVALSVVPTMGEIGRAQRVQVCTL